jgi:hypothetical protein
MLGIDASAEAVAAAAACGTANSSSPRTPAAAHSPAHARCGALRRSASSIMGAVGAGREPAARCASSEAVAIVMAQASTPADASWRNPSTAYPSHVEASDSTTRAVAAAAVAVSAADPVSPSMHGADAATARSSATVSGSNTLCNRLKTGVPTAVGATVAVTGAVGARSAPPSSNPHSSAPAASAPPLEAARRITAPARSPACATPQCRTRNSAAASRVHNPSRRASMRRNEGQRTRLCCQLVGAASAVCDFECAAHLPVPAPESRPGRERELSAPWRGSELARHRPAVL